MRHQAHHRNRSGTYRSFHLYLLLFSTISISIMVATYSLISYPETCGAIGQPFVDNEIPSPSLFPLFTKPITILSILIIVCWFSIMGLIKNRVYSLGSNSRAAITLLFLIASLVSFYEVLFNFMLWGSLISRQDSEAFNPDNAVNTFPTNLYPVNMVFSTKISVVVFGCSLYALVVFWNNKPTGRATAPSSTDAADH